MKQKTIALLVVAALIIAAIFYLESQKATAGHEGMEAASQVNISVTESNDQDATASVFSASGYFPDNEIIAEKSRQYAAAPELAGITGFVNTPEFTLSQLRGKVVLIDFWTYSCINCIRTQPYLNAWHDAYAGDGLVIVGVHTPEFAFEKETANVQQAIEREGIKYPVVQDNNKATWSAYGNRFWPRKYIIDIDGFIRYDHIGEGAYDETEDMIKQLLEERNERLGIEMDMNKSALPVAVTDVDFSKILTPELYFGYEFDRGTLGNREGFAPEYITTYAVPEYLEPNKAYLIGSWLNKADYAEVSGESGTVLLVYSAKNVNIVASSDNPAEIQAMLDGAVVNSSNAGIDGTTVQAEKLYNIVSSPEYGVHSIEITAPKGFRIYTFTFG